MTVASFMFRNNVTWENLIWGTAIILGVLLICAAGIMYSSRLSAKVSIMKKDMPALLSNKTKEIEQENIILREENKILKKDNRELEEVLGSFGAIYLKWKGRRKL